MKNFKTAIDNFFGISRKGSTIGREIFAGVITFLSMAYILFVNPSILGDAGMDTGAVFLATALSAGLTTILMGVFAKYPVALASGMGVNAFFAYTVCIVLGKSWQYALGCVLISGIIFILISVTGIRKVIINAIPNSMKYAVSAGIGGFIAFIGLKNAEIIVSNDSTFVALGSFTNPVLIVGLLGLILTVVLMCLKVKGAILIGLVGTCVIGLGANYITAAITGEALLSTLPSFNISFSGLPSLSPIFGECFKEIGNIFTELDGYVIIFMFLFVDFFDTAGTLVAVGRPAGLINEKGELEGAEKALLVDAIGTVGGAVLGTSTVTSFVESTTGVEAGGRTGLTAVTTGVLLLLASFLAPLLALVTSVVTAPALIVVGVLMASNLKEIDWSDFTIAVPAFTTFVTMILTYSIATGLALGFIMYLVTMVASKRAKEVSIVMYILPIFFITYFVLSAVIA